MLLIRSADEERKRKGERRDGESTRAEKVCNIWSKPRFHRVAAPGGPFEPPATLGSASSDCKCWWHPSSSPIPSLWGVALPNITRFLTPALIMSHRMLIVSCRDALSTCPIEADPSGSWSNSANNSDHGFAWSCSIVSSTTFLQQATYDTLIFFHCGLETLWPLETRGDAMRRVKWEIFI